MPRKKKEDSIFDGVEVEDEMVNPQEEVEDNKSTIPEKFSPEWHEYLMSLFTEEELVDGNPRVSGLRRVARMFFGEQVHNSIKVVQVPTPENERRATVIYEVSFEPQGSNPVYYSDAADCYSGNTDYEIATCPVAVATTRAEARTLRKALGLGGKVIAAEELQDTEDKIDDNAKINLSQINYINQVCKKLGINALAYLKSGETKFNSINEIPYKTAIAMLRGLAKYNNDSSTIPASIKGYVEGWNHDA